MHGDRALYAHDDVLLAHLLIIFAGFFTVNATSDSNMYFWFFPAQVFVFV